MNWITDICVLSTLLWIVQNSIYLLLHIFHSSIEILDVRHKGAKILTQFASIRPVLVIEFYLFDLSFPDILSIVRWFEQIVLFCLRIFKEPLDPQALENMIILDQRLEAYQSLGLLIVVCFLQFFIAPKFEGNVIGCFALNIVLTTLSNHQFDSYE